MTTPGEARPTTPEQDLSMPEGLVDIFYLQDTVGYTNLVGVFGCSDGTLYPATGQALEALPGDLQDQVSALKVSGHERFRAITAPSIAAMSIDTVEQNLAVKGFNDPVVLRGRSRMASDSAMGQTEDAKFIVGRLDLLAAYRKGLDYSFRSPDPTNKGGAMIPFLISGNGESRDGDSLVLAYPVLDPSSVAYADNSYITLHVVYDLLLQLKRDMQEEGVESVLTASPLPAPNREMLVTALIEDGYVVEGDVAKKVATPTPKSGKSMLARLRSLTDDWSAERIELPPEATHSDYMRIIDETLPTVSSRQDIAAIEIIQSRIRANVGPSPRAAQAAHRIAPIATRPSVQVAVSRPDHRNVTPPDEDWRQDFLTTPYAQRARNPITTQWERDFDISDHVLQREEGENRAVSQVAGRTAITAADTASNATAAGWSSDFAPSTVPRTAQEQQPQEWDDDFTTSPRGHTNEGNPKVQEPTDQPASDWEKDFE